MMMKTIPILCNIMSIILLSCTNQVITKHQKPSSNNDLILFDIQGKTISYSHLIGNDLDRHVEKGDLIGKRESYPTILSDKWHKEIIESRKYYSEHDYLNAVSVLSDAIHDEPKNKFILECAARALYQIKDRRNESLEYYAKLLSIVQKEFDDDGKGDTSKYVTIDMWFPEAYWKIGTLYLDCQQWEDAARNIQRAILTFSNAPPVLWEQALMYLSEAYYEQGRYQESNYYACLTLNRFPSNTYVKQYQEKMNTRCK